MFSLSTYAAYARRARRYAARHPLARLVGELACRLGRGAHRALLAALAGAAPRTPGQDLTFAARDGSTVAATFWPDAGETAPGLVMVPGLGTRREVIAPNAAFFAAKAMPCC